MHAFIPTRHAFDLSTRAGTRFLLSAGFSVRLLVNHTSIFAAYEHGLMEAEDIDDNDTVLLLHDDVLFHGLLPQTFARLLNRHVHTPGTGLVGVAGCRTLRPNVVWWRNASSPTALAGIVHHGQEPATAKVRARHALHALPTPRPTHTKLR